MTIREQITQKLEELPEPMLQEILDYVQLLQAKYDKQNQVKLDNDNPSNSTGESLIAHLKTIGNWQGDDFKECLESVISSRSKANFNYDFNPFD
ncbi:MAG: DUF2281 domain-containing protein [Cyanomargarita calcarea GSE-NOS-MK-12-04C]|jgi:diadenosine tetraphosphate (Ap4A) HIT family hydrolase|uniref:DUF2281 domain-containing protein n=1 Tax=Cyanomargarita calcarea GSE-NOS-MK-12-04C TaxID=2839659 RepID=A0A951UW01_9CYAN|nr:DUF2281 domain-containing protein [Cyanomargarita calcarea GSE-NOS-MK-12-04C]